MANLVKPLALLAGGAVCSILFTLPAPSVSALTLIDSTAQSNSEGLRSPFALTDSTAPWDFRAQPYNALTAIERIAVTLTMVDGDTDTGLLNFDRNNLSLMLDGIDTGILLNGFSNNQTETLRIEAVPINKGFLLAALKADGLITGTIFDATYPNPDGRRIPREFTTTLEFIGTAVPFEISPGLGSLMLGAWGAVAYFKTKGQKRKFSGSKSLKTNDGQTQSG